MLRTALNFYGPLFTCGSNRNKRFHLFYSLMCTGTVNSLLVSSSIGQKRM